MKTYHIRLFPVRGLLAAAILAFGQPAFSAVISDCGGTNGIGVGAAEGGTVQNWIDSGPCIEGDKLFDYIGSSQGVADLSLQISSTTAPNQTFYSFLLGDAGSLVGDLSLTYSVSISDPMLSFFNVAMDSDVPGGGGVTVTKSIYSDSALTDLVLSLNSVSGSFVDDTFPIDLQQIWVVDNFVINGSTGTPPGVLMSVSQTYTQAPLSPVPEPGVLFLLSLGLAGLGFSRLKTKK